MKKICYIAMLLLLLSPSQAIAQTKHKPEPNGITISPAFQEVILRANEQAVNGAVAIANQTDTPEAFEVTAIDMGTLDETGGVIFSGLAQDYQQKYGLAKWITLAQPQITVAPRNVGKLEFTIKNEASLSPGGHYGAIVVRRAGEDSADGRITFSPQTASLLFFRKVGGEVYGLSLAKVKANHNIWHLPTKVWLSFKNEGNVHVVPRGVAQVKNTLGQEIARGIINPESALILPERHRTFSVSLDVPQQTLWPGRYRLAVDYRYDGENKTTHYSQTFYTANLRTFVLLVGLILILGLGAYHVRKRKFWDLHKKLRKPYRSKS